MMWLKEQLYLIVCCIVLFLFGQSSSINSPTFTSEWRTLTAQTGATQSETVFIHNLNELPVKVDVQAKVTENGNDYVFSGVGSAQRDDDTDTYYGGVLYSYNEDFVRILVPSFNGGYSGAVYTTKGSAAFTGMDGYIGSGSISGRYNTVDVRVRVWLMCDFGDPVFQYEWVDLDDASYYTEVAHNLGTYPSMLTVQTLCVGTSPPVYSDAQGAVYYGTGVDLYVSIGGVIYGYNDNVVRLWSPSRPIFEDTGKNSAICNYYDGWGSNTHSYSGSGRVRILAWVFPSEMVVFKYSLTMAQNQDNTYEVDLQQQYSLTDVLVTVDVTVNDGLNSGFRFAAAGNSQTDGTGARYGGIIYVYTNDTVLMWRPSDLYNGKIVFIGGIWGGGEYSQASSSGEVLIRVYNTTGTGESPILICTRRDNGPCYTGVCTRPVNSNNVQCTCPGTHMGLYCQLEITTQSSKGISPTDNASFTTATFDVLTNTETTTVKDSSTQGQQPYTTDSLGETSTLTSLGCSEPMTVRNAHTLHNGTSTGCVVQYACTSGYSMVSGNLTLVCQYGSWQGMLPVCSVCTPLYPPSTPSTSEKSPQHSYHINKIDYKSTTLYKHTLECAYDPRMSVVYIGSGGILIICLFVLLPVFIDILNIVHTRNNKHQPGRKMNKRNCNKIHIR